MVSFDSAVMFGTPIKDFGKWQTEVKPVWQSELENPEMPEIWWFRQTKEYQSTGTRLPHHQFKIRGVPALTPQAHQVSMRGYVTLKNITEFVMLRQPNTEMVLLLIPADKYFNALYIVVLPTSNSCNISFIVIPPLYFGCCHSLIIP